MEIIKQCSTCKKELPFTSFFKRPKIKCGLSSQCKSCIAKHIRERRQNNPDLNRKNNERTREWRKNNIEKSKKYSFIYRNSPKGKLAILKYRQFHRKEINKKAKIYYQTHPEVDRKSYLKKRFGLTLEFYNSILKSQNNCCAICGIDNPNHSRKKTFCVDHNHQTNKVRGLLCFRCNMMLGLVSDNSDTLSKAIEYLKKYSS